MTVSAVGAIEWRIWHKLYLYNVCHYNTSSAVGVAYFHIKRDVSPMVCNYAAPTALIGMAI